MTASITFNHKNHTILLTKKFSKAASRFGTEEYNDLMAARRDFPNYKVVVKSSSARKKDSFKGLTYNFMEQYINAHDNAEANLASFNALRGLSDEAVSFGCNSATYGEIKAWFFKTYPEIEAFQKKRDALLAA